MTAPTPGRRDSPPPGWYLDPEGSGERRWWAGSRWYPVQADRGRSLRDFRRAASSPASDRINDILMVLSGLCALVCLIVVLVLDLVHAKSYPNVLPLLAIGIPVLLAGQMWTIAVLNARMYPNGPPQRPRIFDGGVSLSTIFDGMPRWLPVVVASAVAIGMRLIQAAGYVRRVGVRYHRIGGPPRHVVNTPSPHRPVVRAVGASTRGKRRAADCSRVRSIQIP
jgi:hypothetical protein